MPSGERAYPRRLATLRATFTPTRAASWNARYAAYVLILVLALILSDPTGLRTALAQGVRLAAAPPGDMPVDPLPGAGVGPGRGGPQEGADRPPGTDVYLNDSLEAADALRRADELVKKSRWHEAAELIHGISENAGSKLTAVEPDRYTSVRAQAARIVATWPAKGLEAYRALAEPEMTAAIRRLGDSRDYREYLQLFERYFSTSTAAKLAGTIGQLAIESGDFALAERVCRRVLSDHPDAREHAVAYGAMRALAAAMQGKPAPEGSLEGQVRWMGQDRPVAEVVEIVRSGFGDLQSGLGPDAWPTYGGDFSRNKPATTSVDDPGLLWRVRLDDEGDDAPLDADPAAFPGPAVRGPVAFPAVGGELAYVQRDREVIALHVNTGAIAWRFSSEPARAEPDAFLDDRPPAPAAVTLSGGRVFATLPAEEPLFYQYDPSRRGAELVCIDANDGRLVWRVNAEDVGMKTPELSFDPSPLVSQDSVFVVARRRRTFGFEDSYLCQFGVREGRAGFRVHLGSASTTGSDQRPSPIAALRDGTIYACSALGSMVAVSAYTGEVQWATLYRRGGGGFDASTAPPEADSRVPVSPVIWHEDRLFVAPPDGSELLIVDAGDGRLIERVSMARQESLDALLGVRNGAVCGIGRKLACYDLAGREWRFAADMPPDAELTGMPALSGEEILAPTDKGLARFSASDGARDDRRWDARGRGGNLVALPDRLIVAEPGSVAAYLPRANIWRALRDRMRVAPTDPLPAIELAEVALSAGEYPEALEVIEEAVQRLANQPDDPAALRRRVFVGALKLAAGLAARGEADPSVFDDLCSTAAGLAGDTTANVEYRLRFGRLFEKVDAPARALRLYQQVLTDRSLRSVALVGGSGDAAGTIAERRIAALMKAHGREIYSDFEQEARLGLKRAVEAADEQLFRQVIETFPNAAAAGAAFVAYGDWLAAAGRHAEAWRLYALAYGRHGSDLDRAGVAAKLARSLVAIGKREHAWRWLTKASHDVPSAAVEWGGEQVTLLRLRDLLTGGSVAGESVLPRLTLPLGSNPATVQLAAGSSLLIPRLGTRPGQVWRRFFVHAPEAIVAYNGPTAARLWESAVKTKSEVDLLLARDDLAVFATLYEVFALDSHTGSKVWSVGRRPDHVADPGADWEQGGAYRNHAIHDDLLISVRDDGKMTAVSLSTGELHWRQEHRPAAFGKVCMTDPWVFYYIVQDGRVVICVLDADTGSWLGSIATEESRPVEDLFATVDGRAILVSSRTIRALDLASRTEVWQLPLAGQVRPGALAMGWDGLYFSDSGLEVQKVRLDDGTLLWTSERVAERGVDDLVIELAGETLLASTSTSVTGLDAQTGLRLWEGTTPPRPRLEYRIPVDSYLLVIDSAGEMRDEPSMAYFYDHRSGVIPRQGGGLELGRLGRLKSVLAVDGSLILETAEELRVHRGSGEE